MYVKSKKSGHAFSIFTSKDRRKRVIGVAQEGEVKVDSPGMVGFSYSLLDPASTFARVEHVTSATRATARAERAAVEGALAELRQRALVDDAAELVDCLPRAWAA